ncbi:MAG: hypothetical protein D6685_13200 [Bacteroidetes bacterium]|nr:MAG: hypothetical protein D6685_13200 [Bacteroidota bacterium]
MHKTLLSTRAMPHREHTNGHATPERQFRPLVVHALYTGISRGLAADVLAAHAAGGRAVTVCTALIVASHGHVTDVLPVPSDTVDAQIQHALAHAGPTGVKIGIVSEAAAVERLFRRLDDQPTGPVVLDLTLSGPSGEDIINQQGLEALKAHLARPDLVMVRRRDAALVAGMAIESLDDAQVAVQRLHRLGARNVLLRCGQLPSRFFDDPQARPDHTADLFYDGSEFALFEAPHFELPGLHGSSSLLGMILLKELTEKKPVIEAIQQAKGYVAESLRRSHEQGPNDVPAFF